jgi:hypothetical protein
MTWKDFFDFDWDEYAQRISAYTTERLCKQEIIKTRQISGAACTMGGGIGAAPLTMDGTLAVAAYGVRRDRVAKKKLKLIKAGLTRRGIRLHDRDWKDILIPFGASLVGASAGFAFNDVVLEVVPIGTYVVPPIGSTALEAVVPNPANAAQGVASGIQDQATQLLHALLGSGEGTTSAQTLWTTVPNMESALGMHASMLLARTTENAVASMLSA